MSELIKQPHLLKYATDEMDKVIGKDRWVKETDFPNLPFIESILKETMRLHPASVLLGPHLAREDCMVADYNIRKGTTILINSWSIGRDSDIWEDPQIFRPERFLGRVFDVKGQHFEVLPFGSGRRMCPGYSLAWKMTRLILANLLHGFSWSLPRNINIKDINMEELFGLTTQRKFPLVVVPKPRLAIHMYN